MSADSKRNSDRTGVSQASTAPSAAVAAAASVGGAGGGGNSARSGASPPRCLSRGRESSATPGSASGPELLARMYSTERARAIDVFRSLDVDGDHKISRREIHGMLSAAGMQDDEINQVRSSRCSFVSAQP